MKKRTKQHKAQPAEPVQPTSGEVFGPQLPRDSLTGEPLLSAANERPEDPVTGTSEPFARLRNGLHALLLAGSSNLDRAAQEVARAIDEALPTAVQIWPDRERLLPLQQLQQQLSELRYHNHWPKTQELIQAVRELMPILVARAKLAEIGPRGPQTKQRVRVHSGSLRRHQRLNRLRTLLTEQKWQNSKQGPLARELDVSLRTLRNYLDELRGSGK